MALLKDNPGIWMTGEELFRRPDLGPCELVEGRIVPLAPTGYAHGAVEARLAARLTTWAEPSGRGEVLAGEVGIYVRRGPDTVRAADVVFISRERLARCKSGSYLDVAPELVVEVLSPEDRWSDVEEKLADYFAAGVDRVWVVQPKPRRILAFRSPTERTLFEGDQVLEDEEILPGFAVPVADLFPW